MPKSIRYGESSQSIVTSDPLIDSVTYSPLKQIAAIDYHNDTIVTNTFNPDQAYRLTHKETINSLDDVLQDISYTYDNVGNITQTVDNSETDLAKTVAYSYDDLYRLTTASSTLAVEEPNYKETYSYDPIGNITNKSDIGVYIYTNNNPYQVHKAGPITYDYDLNGNLTNNGSLTFNFNWFDRLASTTLNASTTLDFLYDYSGQRTLKQQALNTIDTEFNPITLLYTDYYPNKLYEEKISEVEDDPMSVQSEEVRHIMLGNQTIANVKRTNYSNPSISLVFSDHLGSSAIVTDSLSRVKTIYDYLPYGAERNSDETYNYTTDYRFTGKERDEETNLSYFEQRYLNQDTGRFNRIDPAAFYMPEKFLPDPQQLNSYSYARNNPIRYIDPTGEVIVETDDNGKTKMTIESGDTLSAISNLFGMSYTDVAKALNIEDPDKINEGDSYDVTALAAGSVYVKLKDGGHLRLEKGGNDANAKWHGHRFSRFGKNMLQSENVDGTPHDQGKNSPFDDKLKEELKDNKQWQKYQSMQQELDESNKNNNDKNDKSGGVGSSGGDAGSPSANVNPNALFFMPMPMMPTMPNFMFSPIFMPAPGLLIL